MTRVRALTSLALALTVASGACGGARADGALAAASRSLAAIRSGELDMKLAASTIADPGREAGFRVSGPFALAESAGKLPRAELTVTDLVGTPTSTRTFVSTGSEAYVLVDGRREALPEEQLARYRAQDGAPGLPQLRLERWARDADVRPGGTTDGVRVRRITSDDVDVAQALADVTALAASVAGTPAALPRIDGEDAEHLERAVRTRRLEVLTGEDDDLLRRLRLLVEIATDEPLPEPLARLAGARLVFEVDIRSPKLAPRRA